LVLALKPNPSMIKEDLGHHEEVHAMMAGKEWVPWAN
jgi:hypothetical protein